MAKPNGELRSLTGLRGLAALAVFSLHINGNTGGRLHQYFGYVSNSGGLAVTAFFVLSGTVLAFSTPERQTTREFWCRRATRIYPVYVIGILGASAIAKWSYHSPPTGRVLVATLFLVQAWVPNLNYFFGTDGVAWSLSCEAFFYLLAPFLIRRARRMSQRSAAVAAVVCLAATAGLQLLATVVETGAHGDPHSVTYWLGYICPLTRLPEFVIGILLGTMLRAGYRPQVSPWVVVIFLAITAEVATYTGTYLSFSALALPGFVGLIAWQASAELQGRPGRLAGRGWVFAGRCSYSFYLVHFVVITRVEWWEKFTPQRGLAGVAFMLSCLAVASVLAVALTLGVEQPVRRIMQRRRLRLVDPTGTALGRRVQLSEQ